MACIKECLHGIARGVTTMLALSACVCTVGCVGPHELVLGGAEALPESERAVLEIRPTSYCLEQGWPGRWKGEYYTSDFSRWGEQKLTMACYQLTVPPGPQHIEMRTIWSNGWEEMLVADFEAAPGRTYDIYIAEVDSKQMSDRPKGSDQSAMLPLYLVLWPVAPILILGNLPNSRPDGVKCAAWVACRGENRPIVAFSQLQPK